jgi:hypothetical protein
MFNQTQRAFRLGLSQTDVLESGRMATEMIARELEQMTPGYRPNSMVGYEAPNFFLQATNFYVMALAGGDLSRTNVMQDVYFLCRQNQTWTGVGYFVRTNRAVKSALPGGIGPVGVLYRFETNHTATQFEDTPGVMFAAFIDVLRQVSTNHLSRVLDGVTSFRLRPFDPEGCVIPYNPAWYRNQVPAWPGSVATNLVANRVYPDSGEIGVYKCYNNVIPARLELEIGILEQHTFEQYQSIPVESVRWEFLTNAQTRAVAHMHLFRQNVPLRNVDRAAYQ